MHNVQVLSHQNCEKIPTRRLQSTFDTVLALGVLRSCGLSNAFNVALRTWRKKIKFIGRIDVI